jgi:hypothetical protein
MIGVYLAVGVAIIVLIWGFAALYCVVPHREGGEE